MLVSFRGRYKYKLNLPTQPFKWFHNCLHEMHEFKISTTVKFILVKTQSEDLYVGAMRKFKKEISLEFQENQKGRLEQKGLSLVSKKTLLFIYLISLVPKRNQSDILASSIYHTASVDVETG